MSKKTLEAASGINVLAGLWLVLYAYFVGLGMSSNEFMVGLLVLVISLIGWFSVRANTWVCWVAGAAGVWLLLTPAFVATMTMMQVWNSVLLGIIILAVAVWEGMSSMELNGHGHSRPMGTG